MFNKKVTAQRLVDEHWVCNRGLEWFKETYPDGVTLEQVFEQYQDYDFRGSHIAEDIGWYLENGTDTPEELKKYCLDRTGKKWEEFCDKVPQWQDVYELAIEFWKKATRVPWYV